MNFVSDIFFTEWNRWKNKFKIGRIYIIVKKNVKRKIKCDIF